MSDVVEAMARASFMRNWATDPNGMGEDELFALRKKTDRAVWQMHLANTRAAILAVTEHGGLAVGKMPGDVTHLFGPPARSNGPKVGTLPSPQSARTR